MGVAFVPWTAFGDPDPIHSIVMSGWELKSVKAAAVI